MFNLQGSELVIILLLALVVLGPEKLPDAMRKMGQFYAELRKMSNSFQKEFKAAVDEPMREVRETANILRDSADFRKLQSGERSEKPKSGEMSAQTVAPADASSTPTTDVPFDPVTAPPAAAATPSSNGEATLEQPAVFAPPVARASIVPPPPPVGTAMPPPDVSPPNELPGARGGWDAPTNGHRTSIPPPPPPFARSAPAEEATEGAAT